MKENKCPFCDKSISKKSKRCLNCGQDQHLNTQYKDKLWLSRQYISLKLSANDIAKLCGTNNTTIYYWLNKFEIPIRTAAECQKCLFGEKHSSWKGGRRKDQKEGYIYLNIRGLTHIYNPHTKKRFKIEDLDLAKNMSKNSPVIAEHRLLMAIKKNRPLKKYEVVHHINGIRDDNREENLIVITNSNHKKLGPTLTKVLQERIRELEDIVYAR